jgi:hypothetical protein
MRDSKEEPYPQAWGTRLRLLGAGIKGSRSAAEPWALCVAEQPGQTCWNVSSLEQAGKLEDALDFALQCLAHRLEHTGKDSWWSNRERLDTACMLQKLRRNSEAPLPGIGL